MKRLYVGCRVRVVRVFIRQDLLGKTGRIVANEGDSWAVCLDCGAKPPVFDSWLAESNQLEPIQDPGHQVVSWDACLWQPEGTPA